MQVPPPVVVTKTGPSFNVIFFIVTGLTVLCLAVAVFLIFYGPQSEAQNRLGETCSKGFMLGLGVIFGLMGGKALP